MANQQHLDLLLQGPNIWNEWRKNYRRIQADFTGADLELKFLRGVNLSRGDLIRAQIQQADFKDANLVKANLSGVDFKGADLRGADLTGANLTGANLTGANLRWANLSGVNLSEANLHRARLIETNLSGAKLIKANLTGAYLNRANLTGANLTGADLKWTYLTSATLTRANLSGVDFKGADLRGADLYQVNLSDAHLSHTYLIRADLRGADLTRADISGADLSCAILSNADLSEANLKGCFIYAISAWDVCLEKTIQIGLIITKEGEPTITVDNLEVAQFIYLLLNNKEVRNILDAITSKVVLILGRFTCERKAVLDALRDELSKLNYIPVLFDFEKPVNRDITETVTTLAHLARFIIVDLTDPSSAPHEVASIIPQCIVPVQPLLLQDETQPRYEYVMFHDLRTRYHWVLPTYQYQDISTLLASLTENIIEPAEQKAQELAQR